MKPIIENKCKKAEIKVRFLGTIKQKKRQMKNGKNKKYTYHEKDQDPAQNI